MDTKFIKQYSSYSSYSSYSPCAKATIALQNKLAHIYFTKILQRTPLLNELEDEKNRILKWLKFGIDTESVNKLLTPAEKQYFPIWWSGFYLEDPNKLINPVNDMRAAAKKIKGFSSLDTYIGAHGLQELNKFWGTCTTELADKFKSGIHISNTYSKVALKNNPSDGYLFFNTDAHTFINSDFFSIEVDLINTHYKKLNKIITMHIYNLRSNCSKIILLLQKKCPFIKFICYGKCKTLTDCVKLNPTSNKSIKTNIIKHKHSYTKNKTTKTINNKK